MHEPFATRAVPVTMCRTPDRLTLAAPMPGVQPGDVAVEITAAGRVVPHAKPRGLLKDDKEVLLEEWTVSPYHRGLDLPAAVDCELATVTYGNGVLVVALPTSEHTRPAHRRSKRSQTGARSGSAASATRSGRSPRRSTGRSRPRCRPGRAGRQTPMAAEAPAGGPR